MTLLDTNIVIGYVRKNVVCPAEMFISIVTVGELKAFSIKCEWGKEKQRRLKNYLQELHILDIDNNITYIYAEIDAFSQGKNPNIKLKESAKNMGKNDLWIAATASVFDALLVTTDADYDHLDNILLKVKKIPLNIILEIRSRK